MRTFTLAALLVGALLCSAAAGEGAHRLHGLFCNTEEQLDETLAYMRQNLTVQAAVELTNNDRVVCNCVDKVEYVVSRPLAIGTIPGVVPLIKYRATLVGVVVGGKMRPVEPPASIFLAAPERLANASAEGGA